MHIHTEEHTYLHVHTHKITHTCKHSHSSQTAHMHSTHIQALTQVHTHASTQACTHTNMHTQLCVFSLLNCYHCLSYRLSSSLPPVLLLYFPVIPALSLSLPPSLTPLSRPVLFINMLFHQASLCNCHSHCVSVNNLLSV